MAARIAVIWLHGLGDRGSSWSTLRVRRDGWLLYRKMLCSWLMLIVDLLFVPGTPQRQPFLFRIPVAQPPPTTRRRSRSHPMCDL